MRWSIAIAAVVIAEAPAAAEIPAPPDRSATSPNKDYRATVRTIVTGKQWTRHLRVERAGAIVYDRQEPGGGPDHLLISDDGRVVELGRFRALTIRDPRGEPVVSRQLEDILEDADFGKLVKGQWTDPRHAPGIVGSELVVTAIWGDEVRFRLSDGTQVREGVVVAIPSARERFADLTSGRVVRGSISLIDPDTKTVCTIKERGTICHPPFGPHTMSQHTPEQFAAAITASAVFAPLVNPRVRNPATGWFVSLRLADGSASRSTSNHEYQFSLTVPTLHTPPDLARALATLKKLLPANP